MVQLPPVPSEPGSPGPGPDSPAKLPTRVPTMWRVVAEAVAIEHDGLADRARLQRERRMALAGWLISLAILLGAGALAWHQRATPTPTDGVTVQLM